MPGILAIDGIVGALATTLAISLAVMVALWLLSLLLRDASIVDPYWGPGFLLLTGVAAWIRGDVGPRRALLLALVAAWALRLGVYLLWRRWGEEEDHRYRSMREHHGRSFAWVSLFTVFLLQGSLMWVLSLPLQLVWLVPGAAPLGWLDGLGVALWATGFLFETAGDWQLARFKADPANRGQVMDRGLWGWSRHPNYFGESMVWWGYFAIALATPYGGWTVFSPVLMTFLLLKVSGVTLLEQSLVDRRPGYREYAARTSAFLPLPPRRPNGHGDPNGGRRSSANAGDDAPAPSLEPRTRGPGPRR